MFVSTTKELMAKIELADASYAVCFNIASSNERLLQYLSTEPISVDVPEDEKDELSQQICNNYKSFASANIANTNGVIFVVFFYGVMADDQICSNSCVQLYSKSTNQFTTFAIPGKPHKPKVKSVQSTSITLSLLPPLSDSATTSASTDGKRCGILSYCIPVADTQPNWNMQEKCDISKDITVSNLSPNTTYIFKLAVQYPYGRSEYSDISEPITTLLGKSVQPKAFGLSAKNGVKIEWTPPESYGNIVHSYTIRYKKYFDKEADWNVAKSDNTSIILDHLSPGSIYVCRIVANGNYGEFEESEEVLFDCNTQVGTLTSQ